MRVIDDPKRAQAWRMMLADCTHRIDVGIAKDQSNISPSAMIE